MPADRFAEVLVPVALNGPFSYRVPAEMNLAVGDLVRAPLGNRETLGVVWGLTDEPGGVSHNRLKDILARCEAPPMPVEVRRLVDFLAAYTLTPRGLALRLALRDPDDLAPPRPRVGVRPAPAPPADLRRTPGRERALAVAAADGMARAKGDLAREAGVSVAVIDALVDAGALEAVTLPPAPASDPLDATLPPAALNPAQAKAARALQEAVAGRAFGVHLLDGVTGSGKTEVYLEAIAGCLKQGRQALAMIPEIALTSQFVDRFQARFGGRPALWHSGVGGGKRGRIWTGAASGEVSVVVGARSALFLPFRDLGLIVVDEEHEGAYKQDDGVRYHARDMAIVRAREHAIPIVLASATPSVESRVNADRGRYRRLVLPDRFGGFAMPAIARVDLRKDGPERGRWLSPALHQAVSETLAAKEQTLLFLNRRGYAPLTLCRTCGTRVQCPQCTAWLVDHRFRRRLMCHHCGFSMPPPEHCPSCEAVDSFVACGPGVERIAEECATLWPEARLLVLSSDMAGGIERIRQEIEAVARGEADIVIGTQLVAKGHNFPNLALVGVVDADLALAHGDPRAGERTFQILQQVVGRAGRAKDGSRAILQTHMPDHPVIEAITKGDREAFYAAEIAMREEADLPPFGRLAALLVTAQAAGDANSYARTLARAAPPDAAVRLLGPAEAPIAVIRGRHRVRLLARSKRGYDLSGYLRRWLSACEAPRGDVRLEIDVDPMSFL